MWFKNKEEMVNLLADIKCEIILVHVKCLHMKLFLLLIDLVVEALH